VDPPSASSPSRGSTRSGPWRPLSAAPALRALQRGSAALHRFAELLLQHPPYVHVFENLILGLIVFSVASVGVLAIPGLPDWAARALRIAEILIVVVFTFEYLLRIVAARNKLAFIFSYPGLVDLLAIAPAYLAGFDTRWVRTLRLARALRALKVQTHVLTDTVAERTRELADKNRELAERNASLARAQAQLQAELEVARALQLAILPATFPATAGCGGAARMIPATTMGGDFYDFIELPQGQIGLVIADVSGHGVPAAFFMAVARTNLRDLAVRHHDPGACLAETNDMLCAQNPLDLFVTVFYCMFDPDSGVLHYANAGHNPAYLRRATGSVETLGGTGGVMLGVKPGVGFPTHTVQLLRGDRVVLYTDGVTETCNGAEEPYGTGRLVEEIHVHGGATPVALIERIGRSVTDFAGTAPQADDITLAVLAWNGR